MLPLSISLSTMRTACAADVPFEVVVKSDATLSGIGASVSVNDLGTVAFNATQGGFSRVMVADGVSPPRVINGTIAGANRSFSGVSISNPASGADPTAAFIAAREQFSGAPLSFLLRKWSVASGSSEIIGNSPAEWDSVSTHVDINDSGVIAMAALVSGSTNTQLMVGGSRPPAVRATYSGLVPLRPQISGSGDVVVRDNIGRIFVWASVAANDRAVVGSSSGFDLAGTGNRPGISDDGVAVAFAANRGAGPGVFIELPGAPSGRAIVRVAGEGTAGEPTEFPTEQRIGVTHRSSGGQRLLNAIFVGRVAGVDGVYMRSITIEAGGAVSLGALREVVRVGAAVAGLLGTVSSVSLTDPMSPRGYCAFQLATTASQTAVVRVPPSGPKRWVGLGASQNGVYDWSDGANWSPLGVPVAADDVEIDSAVPVAIQADAPIVEVNSLLVRGRVDLRATGALQITGSLRVEGTEANLVDLSEMSRVHVDGSVVADAVVLRGLCELRGRHVRAGSLLEVRLFPSLDENDLTRFLAPRIVGLALESTEPRIVVPDSIWLDLNGRSSGTIQPNGEAERSSRCPRILFWPAADTGSSAMRRVGITVLTESGAPAAPGNPWFFAQDFYQDDVMLTGTSPAAETGLGMFVRPASTPRVVTPLQATTPYEALVTLPTNASKVCLVVHGTNASADDWTKTMAASMGLSSVAGSGWTFGVIDWRDWAGVLLDFVSEASSISRRGYELGRAYAENLHRGRGGVPLHSLQVCGHSAGAVFSDGFIDRYEELAPTCRTFLVMWDANDIADSHYFPTAGELSVSVPVRPNLGNSADFAVHVVDRRSLKPPPLSPSGDPTRRILESALNIDVTHAGLSLESTSDPDGCTPYIGIVCFHAWPYRWFDRSIGSLQFQDSFGYALTDASGRSIPLEHSIPAYGRGRCFEIGLDFAVSVAPVSPSLAPSNFQTTGSGTATVTPSQATISTGGSNFQNPSVTLSGPLEIAGARSVTFDVTMSGGASTLSILIDGQYSAQVIRDSATAPSEASDLSIYFPSPLGPGAHAVEFLLQSADGTPTQATVSKPTAFIDAAPTASLVSKTDATCSLDNGSIDATVTAATSVVWVGPGGFTATTEDISGLAPGLYTLLASDGSQTATLEVSIGLVPDVTAPVVTSFLAGATAAAGATCTGLVPDFTASVVASDDCTVTSGLLITQSPLQGAVVAVAAHPVTLTIRDAAGNSTVRVATFTVTGTELTYFRDADGDLFGDSLVSQQSCTSLAGFVTTGGDCNDADPAIRPGAAEICDGFDNDCDAVIDEGCAPLAISLSADSASVLPGDFLIVRILATTPLVPLRAAQIVLGFDTVRLRLESVQPSLDSPLSVEVSESIDNAAGTLVYSIAAPAGSPGMQTAAALVDLTFRVHPEATACGEAGMVGFGPVGSASTEFTSATGSIVVPSVSPLGAISIDGDAPVLSGVPSVAPVAADAGSVVGGTVAAPAVTASDSCDGALAAGVSLVYPNGSTGASWPAGGVFPIGVTQVTYSATDAAGNSASASFTVTVANHQLLDAAITYAGIIRGSAPRTLRVSAANATQIVPIQMSQGLATVAGIQVPVAAGYPCVSAKDPRFSLTASSAPSIVGRRYASSLTLLQGDANDDDLVDIADFGFFFVDRGQAAPPDARSNYNGDGFVTNADFAFIGLNFFRVGETCTPSAQGPTPRERITVKELRRRGLGELVAADLNHDGWLDLRDIQLFMQGGAMSPAQPADEHGAQSW